MTNHYHLAIRTPQLNLVSGMQWLQTTFCARFNRFRDERGHVFQGRYKAFHIEPGRALGAVCHYIHLNPIRARMMPISELTEWRGSSLRWLMRPKERPAWLDISAALSQPAQWHDTAKGRRAYVDYLAWLTTDDEEQKKLCFDQLMSGWAVGSEEFKASLLKNVPDDPAAPDIEDVVAARVFVWEKTLSELKAAFSAGEVRDKAKSADWKVAVAAEMKRRTTATNQWLSDALEMGSMFTVSRLAKECRAGKRAAIHLKRLVNTAKSKA